MYNLDDLNEVQKKAACIKDGPVLITAGAGTGKTRVLTHRICYLINECGVPPENILAITFTNKATKEMKERILSMCGSSGQRVFVSTFHSFCVKVLREFIYLMPGYNKYFTIYDDDDKKAVIKRICDENASDDFKKKLSWTISNCKNNGESCFEYESYAKTPGEKDIANCFIKYEEELKKNNSLDFDDLIVKTIELFKNYPQVLETLQDRHKYISVDEFQDTNKTQFMLVELLAKKYKNILIVGDEDQSIYGWRGANYENIFNFQKIFPACEVLKLEENYRCTKEILKKANSLIGINTERFEKVLFTNNKNGEEIKYTQYENDFLESSDVAKKVKEYLRAGVSENDIAVLFRVNSLSRPLETAFINNNIPYKVYGGFKFYDRAEIKIILAYFRCIVNLNDNNAFEKIINFPKRGIGEKTVAQLIEESRGEGKSALEYVLSANSNESAALKKAAGFKELFAEILNEIEGKNLVQTSVAIINKLNLKTTAYNSGSEEDANRLLNIRSLLTAINEFYENHQEATLADYLESITLNEEEDSKEAQGMGVVMATIHSVKGLEFKVVFIVGCEDDIFPFIRSVDEGRIQEERRLMYVAITRARETLFLSGVRSRYNFKGGFASLSKPSRFMEEMGIEAIHTEEFSKYNERYNEDFYYKPKQNYEYKPSYTAQTTYTPNKNTKNDKLDILNKLRKGSELKLDTNSSNGKIKVGSIVEHFRFGQGIVTEFNEQNKSNAIIDFDGTIKELNLQFAPLKLIKE